MKLQKVRRLIFFFAFFLCLHFLLRFWVTNSGIFLTVCNFGGPFGTTIPKWFFIPVVLGALVFLVVQWWRENSFSSEWPWLLIFSGGLANLLERFFFGCITDYIVLPFFPVFNIADVLLTISVLGILWSGYFKKGEKK
ncbi:MAG: signal peptidase II [Candidatus Moranbacteria bacterium]|nr:signal peptidase II [Candidatus Moranbacteria bacterium]